MFLSGSYFIECGIWTVNQRVHCFVWNTTQHMAAQTLEEFHLTHGEVEVPPSLATFWSSSSRVLLAESLNQTLIFTPSPWWQFACTPPNLSRERGKFRRGKKVKKHLGVSVPRVSGVLLSLEADVGSETEMKSELFCVLWSKSCFQSSSWATFLVSQKTLSAMTKLAWLLQSQIPLHTAFNWLFKKKKELDRGCISFENVQCISLNVWIQFQTVPQLHQKRNREESLVKNRAKHLKP